MSRQPLKKIPADPLVALAAWEVPSETRLDLVHHVSILRSEAAETCDGDPAYFNSTQHRPVLRLSGSIHCRRCKALLAFLSCDCEAFTLGNGKRAMEGRPEIPCKHIVACREQWAAEQRTNGRTS